MAALGGGVLLAFLDFVPEFLPLPSIVSLLWVAKGFAAAEGRSKLYRAMCRAAARRHPFLPPLPPMSVGQHEAYFRERLVEGSTRFVASARGAIVGVCNKAADGAELSAADRAAVQAAQRMLQRRKVRLIAPTEEDMVRRCACRFGQRHELAQMLGSGIDPNSWRIIDPNRMAFGVTALMMAARIGHTEYVRMLLATGMRVGTTTGGMGEHDDRRSCALDYARSPVNPVLVAPGGLPGRELIIGILLTAGAGGDPDDRFSTVFVNCRCRSCA
jgi:hypothetical protein